MGKGCPRTSGRFRSKRISDAPCGSHPSPSGSRFEINGNTLVTVESYYPAIHWIHDKQSTEWVLLKIMDCCVRYCSGIYFSSRWMSACKVGEQETENGQLRWTREAILVLTSCWFKVWMVLTKEEEMGKKRWQFKKIEK